MVIYDYMGLNKSIIQIIAQEAGIPNQTKRIYIRPMTDKVRLMIQKHYQNEDVKLVHGVCRYGKTHHTIYINESSNISRYRIVAHELRHVAQFCRLSLRTLKHYAQIDYQDNYLEKDATAFSEKY